MFKELAIKDKANLKQVRMWDGWMDGWMDGWIDR